MCGGHGGVIQYSSTMVLLLWLGGSGNDVAGQILFFPFSGGMIAVSLLVS